MALDTAIRPRPAKNLATRGHCSPTSPAAGPSAPCIRDVPSTPRISSADRTLLQPSRARAAAGGRRALRSGKGATGALGRQRSRVSHGEAASAHDLDGGCSPPESALLRDVRQLEERGMQRWSECWSGRAVSYGLGRLVYRPLRMQEAMSHTSALASTRILPSLISSGLVVAVGGAISTLLCGSATRSCPWLGLAGLSLGPGWPRP